MLYSGLYPSGGSVSAEHGIGSKRTHTLVRNIHPGNLMLMKQVKECLDPSAMLNPGKVLID
ncbi:FAD-linked oxidase C-terminal domain-containing protein [Agrobacterium sp. 22-226-1]